MKKMLFTTLATVVFALANVANAQSLKEVLDMNFKAVGQEKLVAANSYYVKAKMSQMGMEVPTEMKVKKPLMFVVTIEFQGQKLITAFDGENGWMINPMAGPEPKDLSGDELSQARQQADIEGELYNYEAKGHSAELLGKVNLDGKEMYRIKLTTKDGTSKDYFIDTKTNLISKVKSKVTAQGQTVDVEQIMSDYKTIDRDTMAMKVEQKTPMGIVTILMEEFKMNESYDDSIFKKPTK